MAQNTYSTRDLEHWYVLGVTHERERAAGAAYELDTIWRRHGEDIHQDRVAADLRCYRDKAAALAAAMGRPVGWRYVGGPVDWETGMPAASACAWLKRRQSMLDRRVAA